MSDPRVNLASIEPNHWTSATVYSDEVHADHCLELEWNISAVGEQPCDADGNHLPLGGTIYYGTHVAVEVSEMGLSDADGNYDVTKTVASSWITPEQALEVAWKLAEAAQAARDRNEASR